MEEAVASAAMSLATLLQISRRKSLNHVTQPMQTHNQFRYSSGVIRRRYSTVQLESGSQVPYNGFQLTFLGTSSGVPTKYRNVTSIGVRYGAEHWLVDCGEGSQSRIRQSATMNVGRIGKIFITHMHGDHTWGLLGVIASNLIGNDSPNPLTIVGPPGLQDFCMKALKSTHTSCPYHLLKIHEIGNSSSITHQKQTNSFIVFEDSDIIVRAVPIKHSVQCFGYVFEEKTKRGSMRTEVLRELGIAPGPIYKEIAEQWMKETVTLSSGQVLDRDTIMEPPTIGRKIVILGDTSDPTAIVEHAKDATVVVHESTLPSGNEKLAYSRGHSTGTMAARFAQIVTARSLVLTHFSPRFTDDMLTKELSTAKEIFKAGQAWLASDYDVLDVPPLLKSQKTASLQANTQNDTGSSVQTEKQAVEYATMYKYPQDDTAPSVPLDWADTL